MRNLVERKLTNNSVNSESNNLHNQTIPSKKNGSRNNSPKKHPSTEVDEENLKKEKFDILKKTFNSNNINSNPGSDTSASKLFDNKILNVDHAFINSKNPNFTNNSILFRNAEEIQKEILDNLLKDYDYKILEQEIFEEEEKLNILNSDLNNLKGNEDQYGIKRGICKLCHIDCKGYQPDVIVNYISSEKYPGLCLNCGCGASNHIPAEEKLSFFPQEILNLAVNSVLIESNINFNSILVLFEIDDDNNNQRKASNESINKLRKISTDNNSNRNNPNKNNHNNNIFNMIRILQDAGFIINANSVQKLNTESNIYKIKSNIKSFYKANLQKNESYEERKKYEKLIENEDNNSKNILSERKFSLNKFDLVKYFLKDYLDEDKKFIEKVRDNTLDKTIKRVSEIKNLGINSNKNQNSNNDNNRSNINKINDNNNNYLSDLNYKVNTNLIKNENIYYDNNNQNNVIRANSEVFNSPRNISFGNLTEMINNQNKNSVYSSDEENHHSKSNSNINYGSQANFYNSNKNKIKSSVEFENNFFNKFKNEILAVSLSINYQVNIIDFFEKFVLSCNKMFPKKMKLIYYSKSKINALWDVQVLFPELFKLRSFISFICEKPDFYDSKYSEKEKNITLHLNNSLFKTSNKFFALKTDLELKNTINFENNGNNPYNILYNSKALSNKIAATQVNFQFGKLSNINNKNDSALESKDKNYMSYNEFAIDLFNQKESIRVAPDQDLVRKILNKKSFKENPNTLPQNNNNAKRSLLNKSYQNSENMSGCSSDSYFDSTNNKMNKKLSRTMFFKQLFSRYYDFQTSKGIIINKNIIYFDRINDLLDKLKVFDDFAFLKNFSNFVSRGIFNDSLNCSITLNSYLGNTDLINTINDNNFDILNICKSRDIELISNIFFKDIINYDHISIVMRPYIVRSGISEIILNIFKLNNFQILKRKLQVLNKGEAELLFKYEKLDDYFKEYYIKMMTDSNSEIVLLSKFGAINDTKIICNGNNFNKSNKNNTSIIDLLDLNFELELKNEYINNGKHNNGKIYNNNINNPNNIILNSIPKKKKEQFKSIPNNKDDNNLFYNFNDLINFDFIIKKIIDKIIPKYNNSINSNYRYTNLIELRKKFVYFSHAFNICMFIPQEIENEKTQKNFDFNYINKYEIEKHFFPEFSDIQEALIIIKPDPTERCELNDYIKICLNRMNFEILECKKMKLNDFEISNLFEKYFHFITTYEYSQNQEIFLNYECEVIRVVKSGCMLELQNILGKENYDFFKTENKEYSIFEDKLKIMKNNCYLLYNSQESEYFYFRLCEKISKIEGNYLLNFSENIEIILNSILKTTLGEHIRQDEIIVESLINRYLKYFHLGTTEDYNLGLNKIIKQYMFAKNERISTNFTKNFENFYTLINLNNDFYNSNINFFVETENSGFFEIRIPYLQSYIINPTNLARENMINLDINRMQLSKYYHFLSESFFNQLEEKFNNSDIIIDLNDFDYLLKSDNDLYNICSNSDGVGARLFKKTKYEVNKIFYKFCADNYLNITPLTYHYRIKPEDIEIDINRIYEVEEFQGLFFLDVISQDYLGYSDKKAFEEFSYKNINEELIELKKHKNEKFENIEVNNGTQFGFDFNKTANSNNSKLLNEKMTKEPNDNILGYERYSKKKLTLARYYEMALKSFNENKEMFNTFNNMNKKDEKEQHSLSGFLWGRKLAKLCKKFEVLLEKRELEIEKKNEVMFDKNLDKHINQNMPLNFKATPKTKNNILEKDSKIESKSKSKENFFGFNFNNLIFSKTKPDNITNCGPLFFSLSDAKIKGIVVERYLCEYDQYLYINILHDMKTFQELKFFETDIFSEKDYDIVENKLLEVLNSKAFIESRLSKNLTLVPARLKENNLRINRKIPTSKFREKENNINNENHYKNLNNNNENIINDSNINDIFNLGKKTNNFHGLSSDFNNSEKRNSSIKITQLHNYFKSAIYEKTNQTTGKYICLSDVYCMKASVFRYYAAFLFILKIYYKKLDRKTYLLGKIEGLNIDEEYDKMIEAVILGLNHFIDLDQKNDENGFNCYKVEYFLFLISEIKYNLNELKNLQKIEKEIENKIQNENLNSKYNLINNSKGFNQNDFYKINFNHQNQTENLNKEREEMLELKEEFLKLDDLLRKIKKEISDINMNIE